MTKQERITTQAYTEMTKSVAGSNSIVLNDVQGDTTINNHHTHTHNHSDADGKALSMRLTPRPLLSDRQAAAFARTGKLTGSFDLFAS
ncbi:peptidase, partial [Neisseria meningitidis]|nr:peptidase [Neisseria meningitidis]